MSERNTLLIPGDFPPVVSGIATYFFEIWKRLPGQNHYILCPKDVGWKNWPPPPELKIIRRQIPTGNSNLAKFTKGLLYAFWAIILHIKYHFAVIHCGQVLSSGFAGWLMKKIFNVPYKVYVYGSETYRFGSSKILLSLIKTFLMDASHIIPNSHFTMNEFLAIGIPPEKFVLITPGVDTQKFHPSLPDPDLVKRYGIMDKKVLLTVARLDERKGHDQIMRVVAKLSQKFPELVYLIVGKGKEEQKLKNLSKELNINNKVIFTGYIPDEDLPAHYNLCDIFILLNRQTKEDPRLQGDYEGFGIVFLEASACGKPVIAGRFGGIQDAVEDLKSGFIIDPENIEEVCEKVEILLTNKELREKMGHYGRIRAEKYFDWSVIASKIETILYD